MATKTTKKKLTNGEAWAQATNEIRASWGDIGGVDDGATLADTPRDDRAFWEEVEKRAVELGGLPTG
jgi:hypothetical protein